MKIIASIPAYKEALFLDYAIAAVHGFVDEVIITNTAMRASLDMGCGYKSNDGTEEIIEEWTQKHSNVHALSSKLGPKGFKEMMQPAFELAKKLDGNWLFTVGADEIWPKQSLVPMRSILKNCERNNILGLNAWMWLFAPDLWSCKDFRNPRFARLTEDCELTWGDSMRWPSRDVYQFAGNTEVAYPPGTPAHVVKANSDYPRQLRACHYSCVGAERIKFKVDFYQKFDGTNCDRYVEAYINKDWKKYKEMGFRKFTGKHPEVMINHPLYNEKLLKWD